jgi:hypothetical protein
VDGLTFMGDLDPTSKDFEEPLLQNVTATVQEAGERSRTTRQRRASEAQGIGFALQGVGMAEGAVGRKGRSHRASESSLARSS